MRLQHSSSACHLMTIRHKKRYTSRNVLFATRLYSSVTPNKAIPLDCKQAAAHANRHALVHAAAIQQKFPPYPSGEHWQACLQRSVNMCGEHVLRR